MKKILIALLVSMSLFTGELGAQQYKPLSAMTRAEINALSDARLKELVINDWGSQLMFMIRGVEYPTRVVDAFAENFREGAIKWLNKTKWVTVDYIVAEELLSFYQYWNGQYYYNAVQEMHSRIPARSVERVVADIMYETDKIYSKQRAGLINVTPPELVGAAGIINSLISREEAEKEHQESQKRAEIERREKEEQRISLLRQRINNNDYFKYSELRNSDLASAPVVPFDVKMITHELPHNMGAAAAVVLELKITKEGEPIIETCSSGTLVGKMIADRIMAALPNLDIEPTKLKLAGSIIPINTIVTAEFREKRNVLTNSPIRVVVKKKTKKGNIIWTIENEDDVRLSVLEQNRLRQHYNNGAQAQSTLNIEKLYDAVIFYLSNDNEMQKLKNGKHTLNVEVEEAALQYLLNGQVLRGTTTSSVNGRTQRVDEEHYVNLVDSCELPYAIKVR